MSAPIRKFPAPCWTHDETLALIDAYRDKWYSLRRGNLRAAHWDAVSSAISLRCQTASPTKTSIQCRHKIEKLRQRYRAEKQRYVAYPGRFCSSWVFFASMDSMENGSKHGQNADDLNPNFDFDGNNFHVKSLGSRSENCGKFDANSSPNPCFEQEAVDTLGGFCVKSLGNRSSVPLGSRANNGSKFGGYANSNLVSDPGGGFLVKTKIDRNLEAVEIKSKDCSKTDGKLNPNLDFQNNTDEKMNAGRRFRVKTQVSKDLVLSGIRSKNYVKIDGNSNSNLGENVSGDGFWVKNPIGQNYAYGNSNGKLDSRVLNGCPLSPRLGLGKESRVTGIKREPDPISEMVSSIRMLGEGFVRMEKMKMEMARDIEKMRMEMEMKRSEMLLESQQQIVDAFVKAFLEEKKKKVKMASSDT